ncbi:MAG: Holliday junction resolvase RuvX [Rhodobacteraceae bacterium]|nr:Holliday junction resolvase RuvX [Paracoccaceae bacterium]
MRKFRDSLRPAKPLVALDVGTKTIGIAISDSTRTVASPLKTLPRKAFTKDVKLLLELFRDRQIGGIVVGLPKNMDGSEGRRCQATRAFARNLCRVTDLPVTYWDERLSTVAAERYLIETGASRRKRARVIDRVAASLILQPALENLAMLNSQP